MNTPDYIVEWVLRYPSFQSSEVGNIGAQIVVCAEKGWLTVYFDPADGNSKNHSLILTRTCASMPPQASLGERALLEALFGQGLSQETRTLQPYKQRDVAKTCWRAARSAMLEAGILERKQGMIYAVFRNLSWRLPATSQAMRDQAVARNEGVLRHLGQQPTSLLDALAAGSPTFANPPLHAPDAQQPRWFSSVPNVESEVGGGFFMAAHLLAGAFV